MSEAASRLEKFERGLITLLLLAMVALPLGDRLLFHLGRSLPSSAALVSHLALILTMLGGLLAAARRRLIATPIVLEHLPARPRAVAAAVGQAAAAVICLQLARAAWHFVSAERGSSAQLLPGLPLWLVELVIPVGFLLIGARVLLVGHASARARVAVLLLALAGAALCLHGWDPATGRALGLVALLVALLCGCLLYTSPSPRD